ncbi:MAG: hypothetical protein ACD_61C00306G0001 [uncultured bacterium]|nr:MAG: hypothetical protein ACD_61C00306G0001 [uncultured bacterium]KKT29629.1 MAG: hypothetical protein UW16_C0026G0006 [Microgenomates group bacterium GW2011_GWC1_44_10]
MSQACCKIPSNEDVQAINESVKKNFAAEKPKVSPALNSFQGDIGEMIAAQVATEQLNLRPEFYDSPGKSEKGIDLIYRDGSGKLVLIEAKNTEKGARASLTTTKTYGREGSIEWIEYHAKLMCDPSSSRYSPDNAKLGEEILRVGAANVTFYIIHTNPSTLKTDTVKIR